MNNQAPVGIVSTGMYLPKKILTAAEIAAQSGMPEWVVREKLGLKQKYVAGPEEHPNQMAIWAAQDCLAKCDLKPEEIDVVLCTTEEWKEYLLWTAGIHLAHEIGATNAWAMDLHMRCCTTIAAMLLRKDWPANHVLGSHLMIDGSMSKHVIVPASGTVQHPTDEAVAQNLFYFDLVEPEAMKSRLNEVSMENWMRCIDAALRQSGMRPDGQALTRADIDFLNMILVKPSAHRDMLARLGLREEQAVYLSDYGHIGEQDSIIAMIEGEKQGRLKAGDLMMMVGAGIGYVWGAACVRWGKSKP